MTKDLFAKYLLRTKNIKETVRGAKRSTNTSRMCCYLANQSSLMQKKTSYITLEWVSQMDSSQILMLLILFNIDTHGIWVLPMV